MGFPGTSCEVMEQNVVGRGQEGFRHCSRNLRQWRKPRDAVCLLILNCFLRFRLVEELEFGGMSRKVYLCECLPLEACAHAMYVNSRPVSTLTGVPHRSHTTSRQLIEMEKPELLQEWGSCIVTKVTGRCRGQN